MISREFFFNIFLQQEIKWANSNCFLQVRQKLTWGETKRTTLFLRSIKKDNFFDKGGAIAPNVSPRLHLKKTNGHNRISLHCQ